MKKKVLCLGLALLLLLMMAIPSYADSHAQEPSRQAVGSCSMSISGHSITIMGRSLSSYDEDTIRVSVNLWELRDGKWYRITNSTAELSNARTVSTSKTVTVTGGYYYKVTASHYSCTDGVSYNCTSYTSQTWVA